MMIDQPERNECVAMTIFDHLAATTHPEWSTMIDQRRRTGSPNEATQDRAAKWGRTGGTFHKDIGGGNEEFFKK